MAVKIRLKRMGKIRAPYYRIVVADSKTKRDGQSIEQIGQYHPKADPSHIQVQSDRAQYWLSVGAQPSEPVLAILKKTGDWQKFKGEPAPEPLLVAAPKGERRAMFDAALSEAHADGDSEAVSQKKTAKKTAKKSDTDKSKDSKAGAKDSKAEADDKGAEKTSENADAGSSEATAESEG